MRLHYTIGDFFKDNMEQKNASPEELGMLVGQFFKGVFTTTDDIEISLELANTYLIELLQQQGIDLDET